MKIFSKPIADELTLDTEYPCRGYYLTLANVDCWPKMIQTWSIIESLSRVGQKTTLAAFGE